MRNSNRVRRLLETGASIGVLCALAAPALAQTASPQTSDTSAQTSDKKKDTQTVHEVVVTARRAAIESAIKRKEHSDTIVDSVVAEEAGKLPDNSVTEVLQRVVGVAISRFDASQDLNHYSAQGSGLTVRGLSGLTSTLNGRESFSANGSRGLSWEDVPPELMAAVDIYKGSTSDLIEGGLAGSINMVTRMPFDYKGQEIDGSFYESYGDIVKQARPSGSLLYSNRWDTSIGQVGFLLDASFAEFAGKNDSINVATYQPQLINGAQVEIPTGYSYQYDTNTNLRTGLYEATQWSPFSGLTFFQTIFYSAKRTTDWNTGLLAGGTQYQPVPGTHTDIVNGQLLEADQLYFAGWSAVPCPGGQGSCGYASGDSGLTHNFNRTMDFSEGFTWQATDRLRVKGALQYVDSGAHSESFNVFSQTTFPSFGIDTRQGLPTVKLGAATSDPAFWIWNATMDEHQKHEGRALAANVDADLWLSDTNFLRSLKFGARFKNQKEDDDVTPYNWVGLSPWWSFWSGAAEPACSKLVGALHCLAASPASTYQTVSFNGFFKGQMNLPAVVFPSAGLVQTGDVAAWHQMFGFPGDNTKAIGYVPIDNTYSSTRNGAIYARANFGLDNLFGMKMDGNFGLRLVRNDNESQGNVLWNNATVLSPAASCPQNQLVGPALAAELTHYGLTGNWVQCNLFPQGKNGGYVNKGGRQSTTLLPSFNIQLMPTPQTHIRFAYSRGVTLPSFSNAQANGSYGPTENNLPSGYALYLSDPAVKDTGSIGTPNLKPQLSDNYDISFEWYPHHGGMAHLSLFAKTIKDLITTEPTYPSLLQALPDGSTTHFPGQITAGANTAGGKLEGAEIGYNKFFDFLPKPFDGLGIDTNLTYIHSKLANSPSTDIWGTPINDLPLTGLSKYIYNIQLMYEKNPLSMHLAWNWRSKYMLGANADTGNFQNSDPRCSTPPNGVNGTCNYSLPVWSAPYGQLDFGVRYQINSHVNIGIEGSNVTNSIARNLSGGYGTQLYGRYWFMADSFYRASLNFHF